jgi:hypothetical protein
MIIDADSTEFVTLAEVKDHLNKTSTANDDELTLMRNAAQDHVESLVGPVLWREVVQSTASRPTVVLHTLPIVSVDTVGTDPWSAQTYPTDLAAGIVEHVPSATRIDITYTAGRTDCPEAIRLATLVIVKHLWETQRGRSANRVGTIPDGERTPPDFLIPHRAEALLRPYMQLAGFA